MVTVWLDVLFLLNFGVDWLLLRGVAYMTRRSPPRLRMAGAAALGAGLACFRALLRLPGWFVPVYTGITAGALCALAFGTDRRALAVTTGLFWGLSCLFAGLVTAFVQLGSGAELPMMVFILASLAFYLLSGLFSRFTGQACDAPATLTVTIDGRTAKLYALRDSGHSLRDPLTGRDSAIVSWEAVRWLFPAPVQAILDGTDSPHEALAALGAAGLSRGFSLLPCRTVQGTGMLLGYARAEAAIDGEAAALVLALTHEALSDAGTFQAIIRA